MGYVECMAANTASAIKAKSTQKRNQLIEIIYNKLGVRLSSKSISIKELEEIANQ